MARIASLLCCGVSHLVDLYFCTSSHEFIPYTFCIDSLYLRMSIVRDHDNDELSRSRYVVVPENGTKYADFLMHLSQYRQQSDSRSAILDHIL
jgi:hypothetical protein